MIDILARAAKRLPPLKLFSYNNQLGAVGIVSFGAIPRSFTLVRCWIKAGAEQWTFGARQEPPPQR